MPTASAPGRVNLLGEHVDHQGGTVLPVAIDLRTTVAYEPGGSWRFESAAAPDAGWTRYPRAVLAVLAAEGIEPAPGRVTVRSTLPAGAGLASSAALEVALMAVWCDADPWTLARWCRRAESEHTGVPCGLMDQAASACGKAGHVLVLACATETYAFVELPDIALLVVDSGVRRRLQDTPYAARAEEAADPNTPAGRHVLEEMDRVRHGFSLLQAGDAEGFARLLDESHLSLKDQYRCSTPELDAIVERCRCTPGVLGARLTGAGWGGAVIALARPGTELDGAFEVRAGDGVRRG